MEEKSYGLYCLLFVIRIIVSFFLFSDGESYFSGFIRFALEVLFISFFIYLVRS